jgi:NAD(P)-dependent dehydrogenase (short-subunit alcohol dehydrogenase family)
MSTAVGWSVDMTTEKEGSAMAEPQEARPVALVTGGNKGIGRAIVAGLAEKGFVVYLGARDAARGEEAAAELCTFGDVLASSS